MREDFPIYGYINDEGGFRDKLPVRLYKENDKIKLELLDQFQGFGFANQVLCGVFEGVAYKIYVTFLRCEKDTYKPEIKFAKYIAFEDFQNKDNETFIMPDTPRKSVCFTINNFEKWIYPHLDICQDLKCKLLDKEYKEVPDEDAKYFLMEMFNGKNIYNFKYKGNNISLSIINEFCCPAFDYPKIEIYPRTYIKIELQKEENIMFYKEIITILNNLFSLFINEATTITSIYEFEMCKYRIDYEFASPKINKTDLLLQSYNISFKDVNANLSEILQKWFNIYDKYRLIINSVCSYERPKYLEDAFNRQAQLIETYGNIHNKGGTSRENIVSAVKKVKINNFKKLFHLLSKRTDYLTFQFDLRRLGATPQEQMKAFGHQIMNIRNHFTHPYKQGKLKTPKQGGISEVFTYGDTLNTRGIRLLSNHLSKLLIVLLLQELKIDKLYRNINF